jgi:acetyl-CoA acetyltransferase
MREDVTMLDAYLYTGLRSPFGRYAGALARLRPDDMLAAAEILPLIRQHQMAA